MAVLVLQEDYGATGVAVAPKAHNRALEHARDLRTAAFLDRCARSGLLGVQQPPGRGARQVPEEEAEQVVVQDLLNDSKGG